MASQVSTESRPISQTQNASASKKSEPGVNLSNLMIYIVLIIGAIVALIPFFYTVSVSVMNVTEATGGRLLAAVPRVDNYITAWSDANFSLYLGNSIKITLITLAGELVFSTLAAYAFARMEFPGKGFLFTLLL